MHRATRRVEGQAVRVWWLRGSDGVKPSKDKGKRTWDIEACKASALARSVAVLSLRFVCSLGVGANSQVREARH